MKGIASFPAGASAMRSVAGPQSRAAPIVVGPIPNRRERRMAVIAASRAPTLPSEMTSPITPAERPSSRTKKTMTTANDRLPKKFEVAVQPA
jgi:hypothetical protein